MITFSMLGKYGRLGNQMFQIASTIGIAVKSQSMFFFPEWEYNGAFRRYLPLLSPDIYTNNMKLFKESDTNYHDIILDNRYDWDLLGYFQSHKYFDKEYVDYYFNFDYPQETLKMTSIHIRRGDYLDLPMHNILSSEYYSNAMKLFPPNTEFLLFSDDVEWCRNNLDGKIAHYCESSDPMMSLYIMSCCENNIIANSSFSWWGAYLNKNPDKMVVCPKQWILGEERNDRIVEGWVAI